MSSRAKLVMSAVEKRETSNDELAGNSREAGGVRSALPLGLWMSIPVSECVGERVWYPAYGSDMLLEVKWPLFAKLIRNWVKSGQIRSDQVSQVKVETRRHERGATFAQQLLAIN